MGGALATPRPKMPISSRNGRQKGKRTGVRTGAGRDGAGTGDGGSGTGGGTGSTGDRSSEMTFGGGRSQTRPRVTGDDDRCHTVTGWEKRGPLSTLRGGGG